MSDRSTLVHGFTKSVNLSCHQESKRGRFRDIFDRHRRGRGWHPRVPEAPPRGPSSDLGRGDGGLARRLLPYVLGVRVKTESVKKDVHKVIKLDY